MKIEEIALSLDGRRLHRLLLTPEGESKGGLVFFHGQGDYIDRYPTVLQPLVDAGLQCILTDFPGHGRSSGRRGAIPGLGFIDHLLNDSLKQLRGPITMAGHSMGGLLALRAFLNEPRRFSSAWFSSPLLDPMRQAKPWMRLLLPTLSRLFPWLPADTGVRGADCRVDLGGESSNDGPVLYHSKITLGWGRDLRDAATDLAAQFPNFPTDLPILFTQGALDPICPASLLRERLKKLPPNQITYAEISSALHEPFTGPSAGDFADILSSFVSP